MEGSILSLIEKGEESIKELSFKIEMDISQTKLFLKYFHKFNILSSLLDSKYVNYFNKIILKDLKENDALTDENFVKTIIIFIKEKRKNKKWYYLSLQKENDIKLEMLILSQLDYKSLKFEISYNEELDLMENLDLFNYISYINDNYVFEKLIEKLINNQIDAPIINCVNINSIPFDKVLNYSRKYPNRIQYIDFDAFNEYDKLKELIELNKESLICYPHCNMKYLVPLKNAYMLNLIDPNGNNGNNYDFTKITIINTIICKSNDKEKIVNILNKCPNIEEIAFSEICSEHLFYILENINCPKIKIILGSCEDIDNNYDWSVIFDKMPLLEELSIEECQTMLYAYSIYPIFTAERKRLPFPLLEQLIRNYLNGNEDRDIQLIFDDEFEQFWDYFKNKKDIISRVSKLDGASVFDSIEKFFKITFNKYGETVENIKTAKYYYCFVNIPFDDKMLEFVKNNKVEYLVILNGGNINIDELKKCDELKFIFDKVNKNFFYKNNVNNILEKI